MSATPTRRLLRLHSLLFVLGLCSLSALACNARKKQAGETGQAAPSAMARSRAKPHLTRRSDPPAPLEQFVQQHVEQGDASGVRVLVYVGATWCEPCKRFHAALESGELDQELAGTHFIEFDADRDRAELRAAGYASKYIPLFSVPDPTGRSTGRAIEGSIKGDKSVRENLVPRLLALLDGKPTE